MERQSTIEKLFYEKGIQFTIPSYQRAYSWEYDKDKKQVKQFITDIKEQDPEKKYFLGHFLFERDKNDINKYWVIDGQQRLTTVIIFFSCLIRELEERQKENEIKDKDGEVIELWRIYENYIRIGKKYKFSTVTYDNLFFENLIYENKSTSNVYDTSSKNRINKAKKVFEELLKNAEIPEILSWKKIIDDAVITTFEVTDKIQATQIFAFQNDRGKDLTNLEKLKAYLMHKIYTVVDYESAEELIKIIETEFSDIYHIAERLSYDEDRVLNFHNIAYLSSENNALDNIKGILVKIKENTEKEKWIKEFVLTLKETFFSIEIIEEKLKTNNPIADVVILDESSSIPLLIKLFHFNKDNEDYILEIAKITENILFKLKYKNADYRTNSLPTIARHYNGKMDNLKNELVECSKKGFQWWWEFNKNCKNYFLKNNIHYDKNIKYVLWKYENYLRSNNRTRLISPVQFLNKFDAKRLENTIDHITPQNPSFIKYQEEFIQNYLHNIGNLVLMVWGDNSEKRNNDPVDEINLYDSDYYSHKEIRDMLKKNKKWGKEEIELRKKNIFDFIIINWGL